MKSLKRNYLEITLAFYLNNTISKMISFKVLTRKKNMPQVSIMKRFPTH